MALTSSSPVSVSLFSIRMTELAVVSRDGAKAYLVESTEFAAKDRPQIAIETDTIEDMFEEVSVRAPHILHPRSNQIELKPWGFREFAVRDKTDVCVVFRQPAR